MIYQLCSNQKPMKPQPAAVSFLREHPNIKDVENGTPMVVIKAEPGDFYVYFSTNLQKLEELALELSMNRVKEKFIKAIWAYYNENHYTVTTDESDSGSMYFIGEREGQPRLSIRLSNHRHRGRYATIEIDYNNYSDKRSYPDVKDLVTRMCNNALKYQRKRSMHELFNSISCKE